MSFGQLASVTMLVAKFHAGTRKTTIRLLAAPIRTTNKIHLKTWVVIKSWRYFTRIIATNDYGASTNKQFPRIAKTGLQHCNFLHED